MPWRAKKLLLPKCVSAAMIVLRRSQSTARPGCSNSSSVPTVRDAVPIIGLPAPAFEPHVRSGPATLP